MVKDETQIVNYIVPNPRGLRSSSKTVKKKPFGPLVHVIQLTGPLFGNCVQYQVSIHMEHTKIKGI